MVIRILSFFILLTSILYLPFWVSVILILGAMVFFSYYWEGVIIFFLSDLLYGVKEIKFFNLYFISLILSFALLLIIEFIKKKIRVIK